MRCLKNEKKNVHHIQCLQESFTMTLLNVVGYEYMPLDNPQLEYIFSGVAFYVAPENPVIFPFGPLGTEVE